MDAAVWATVVVALAGYVASFLTVRYTGRQAYRQLLAQKSIERDNERLRLRDEECRRFVTAARLIRHRDVVGLESVEVGELRRAAAGLELYAPDLVPGLEPAVVALENLVTVRGGAGWRDSITEAEVEANVATQRLVEAMRESLGVGSLPVTH